MWYDNFICNFIIWWNVGREEKGNIKVEDCVVFDILFISCGK